MCTIFTTGNFVLAFMVKFSSTWVWHWLVSTSSFLLGVMWLLSLACVGSAQPFYTISYWYSLAGQLLRQCGSTLSWSRSLEYSHSRQDSLSKLAYLHGVNCDYVTNRYYFENLTKFYPTLFQWFQCLWSSCVQELLPSITSTLSSECGMTLLLLTSTFIAVHASNSLN